jgi:acyl-CoA dehydrogenase
MQEMIADAMEQLLAGHCTAAVVRRIEQTGEGADLWSTLQASGFIDALVAEQKGGSGLSLADAFPIAFCSGRYALPLPLAHTAFVRSLCQSERHSISAGPIAIACAATQTDDGGIHCAHVSFGRVAQWILVDTVSACYLLPIAAAVVRPVGGHGSVDAEIHWASLGEDAIELPKTYNWRAIGACVSAALLAGAQQRVFEMTLAFANDRVQFGKPIAKFQAIQQQLSVMAEQVFAAKMAAEIGFSGAGVEPASTRVAIAKARTSVAAPKVAEIAHAVHGAMGFTDEYDLQLFTRRLHEWRMAFGSESYWHRQLGDEVFGAKEQRVFDFVQQKSVA